MLEIGLSESQLQRNHCPTGGNGNSACKSHEKKGSKDLLQGEERWWVAPNCIKEAAVPTSKQRLSNANFATPPCSTCYTLKLLLSGEKKGGMIAFSKGGDGIRQQ
jgi:hypothetical protein